MSMWSSLNRDFIPYSSCSSLFKHCNFCIQFLLRKYRNMLGCFPWTSDSEIPFRENFLRQLNYSSCSLPVSTTGRHFLDLISKCYSSSSLNFLFWCYIGHLHKTEELSQILLLPLQSYWPPRSWTGVNEGRIWRNRLNVIIYPPSNTTR